MRGMRTRRWLRRTAAGAALLLTVSALSVARPVVAAPTTYEPTWESVDQHPAAAEWFQDAKFGIYFHWGAFSVPAYNSEWYPRHMYVNGHAANTHHRDTYGEPTSWMYHNFIDGATNRAGQYVKFAPKLKAQGGNFDPDEWAQLFADSGARFAGPVAEHHDGFSMWDSQVNEWNSVDKGPGLDLLRIFRDAIRAKDMKLLVAMHHAYNFTGFYDHVPAQSDASLRKLYGQLGAAQQNQLWYDKLKEVVDRAEPDIIWQDFDLSKVDERQRLNFLSYYYNQANRWGREVVATYKDGFNTKGAVFDYERGGPADIQHPYWLTDDAISSSSWSYTNGIRYYSSAAMLHSLIDRVSKNGNMLLNISPTADGTIPQGQRDVLGAIGGYLKRNGESIYSTRAWGTFGEGPTKMGGGSFVRPRAGTAQDIRYTRSKDNTTLYATVLGWPGDGTQLNLASLASGKADLSGLRRVELIGDAPGTYLNLPTRTQDANGLRITLPSTQPYPALAYVVKLTFNGQIGGGGGTTGRLLAAAAGRCLDVPARSQAVGTPVSIYDCNGGPNQQWTHLPTGALQVYGTRCLSAPAGATAGAAATIDACTGGTHQQWTVNADGTVVNRASGLCLDVYGARTANGTPVDVYPCNGRANQRWSR